MNQRWREGRASYRPPLERIVPHEYEAALVPDDTTARRFIEAHHYSRTYPAARVRVGLYRRGVLAGVAVFSHPARDAVLTNTFAGVPVLSAAVLGRFVLLDEVPGNGETWFLARCFELMRARGFRGVVSFSDPHPRTTLEGVRVFPGHVGTIYQAHNARYLGRAAGGLVRLLPDGTILDHRSLTKIRAGDRGWLATVRRLVSYGAAALAPDAPEAERVQWLARALAQLTRPMRHPGNHKYAWALRRAVAMPAGQPYPKRSAA